MPASRNSLRTAVLATIASVGLVGGFAANTAKAAPSLYFDRNGVTTGSGVAANGNYSWESAFWTTSSAGTAATTNYTDGDFTRFSAGTDAGTKVFTVTANSNHIVGGFDLQTNGGGTVNIAGSGILSLADAGTTPNVQGVLVATNTNLVIKSQLSGIGGVENEGSGSLYLYGPNDYSGGTAFGTSAGLNYNNNNSFGTGSISYASGTTFAVIADPSATGPVTIANNVFGSTAASSTMLITGAQPTTFSGAWAMTGTSSLSIGNGSFPSAVVNISGAISGPSANIIKSGTGMLIISGNNNTYNGTTTVTAGTLQLGAANTIASSSKIVMNGGTLDPDDLSQVMSTTTMGMTASSTITYAAGNSADLEFANSAGQAWTGTLNLTNWTTGFDLLRFGTDGTGLTNPQLADIEFNGDASTKGTAVLTAAGYVVPEPTTIAMLLLGAPLLAARRRRS